MGELEEQIRVVAEARKEWNEAIKTKDAAVNEWQDANKGMFLRVQDSCLWMGEAEAKLRELTLLAYDETGSKTPAEGVGIREVMKLEYDPKEAYKWGIEHKLALTLDKKAFEVIAKTSEALDFVTITTEPQATISQDLSGVLE